MADSPEKAASETSTADSEGKEKEPDHANKYIEEKYEIKSAFTQMSALTDEEMHRKINHFVQSHWFTFGIMTLLVLDIILLGAEVSSVIPGTNERPLGFLIVNVLVALAFIAEFACMFDQLGWEYFFDIWRCLDYLFLYMSFTDLVFVFCGESNIWWRLFALFRAVRLLKVAYRIKSIPFLQGLWMVIQLSINSCASFLWTCVLLVMVVYVFAIVLTTFVGQDEYVQQYWPDSEFYVGSVWRCSLTMMEVITLDDWATGLARPLSGLNTIGQAVAIMAVFVGSFGLLNLLLATMVEGALALKKDLKHSSLQQVYPAEQYMLDSAEKELNKYAQEWGRGILTAQAFSKGMSNNEIVKRLKMVGVSVEEAQILYDLLCCREDVSVTAKEFMSGIQRIKGEAMGADIVTMICFAQQRCAMAAEAVDRIRELSRKVDSMLLRLSGVGRSCTDELVDRRGTADRWEKQMQNTKDRIKVLEILEESSVSFPGRMS